MKKDEVIKIIFENKYIKDKAWLFEADIDWEKTEVAVWNLDWEYIEFRGGVWYDGHWKFGRWKDGIWYDGYWDDGFWEDGEWHGGYIYDPYTKKYKYSGDNPNVCNWSLSYGKT